jgi:hypothetical protein
LTEKKNIRVNLDVIKPYNSIKNKPFLLFLSYLWAKIHLLFICPLCNKSKRKIRDIYDLGECYWYSNWMKNNYDIPFWMGFKEWQRIRRELKLKKKFEEDI